MDRHIIVDVDDRDAVVDRSLVPFIPCTSMDCAKLAAEYKSVTTVGTRDRLKLAPSPTIESEIDSVVMVITSRTCSYTNDDGKEKRWKARTTAN